MADEYREFAPDPRLGRFVDRFWTRSAFDPKPTRILPDGCMDVLISATTPDRPVMVGAMTRAEPFSVRGSIQLVGVRFRPGAAAAFFHLSAPELTDRTASCEELGMRWLRAAQIVERFEPAGAVRCFERQLISRAHTAAAPDPKIDHAVAVLSRVCSPSVAELARDIGWSRQQLRRVFRERVGVSPKHFARTARLHRAIDRLQRHASSPRPAISTGKKLGLAATALELGYFDQAHMHRDFRELAGGTPRILAASPGSIFPIRSLFGAPSSRS